MNILICSDLHTNFNEDNGKSFISNLKTNGVDAIVIAGDLTTIYNLEYNIKMLCDKYENVIYVTGNHEYYDSSFDKVDNMLLKIQNNMSNLIWLNNSKVKLNGINFIGATLWFKKTMAAQKNKHHINDFKYINSCDPICFEKYNQTVDFFKKNIKEGDVVITHHLPTYKSVSPMYLSSNLNCFFANNLDSLIIKTKPSIWIHGHTHTNCNYTFGNTRIYANPFGYPHENKTFISNFIVKI